MRIMAHGVGLEPTTYGVTTRCSTFELPVINSGASGEIRTLKPITGTGS